MKKQMGYSIVEIAIALVVLGILLGSTLVPLQVRLENKQYKAAETMLDDALHAVVNYSATHRTAGINVGANIGDSYDVVDASGIAYILPTGRPYLPCPDIDGDGVEDRTDVTVTSGQIDLTGDVFKDNGTCEEQKGLLPWRSLGLQKQLDPWGRKLGYWVDIAFSSSLLGFDQTSRADIFDPRVQTTLGFYNLRDDWNSAGGIVCSHLYATSQNALSVVVAPGCPEVATTSGTVSITPRASNVLSGIITYSNLTLGSRIVPGYERAAPSGLLEGAAFVIFSHGKNGWGGINVDNRCLRAPALTNNLFERANAYYAAGHPFLDITSFRCEDFNGSGGGGEHLSENIFVSAPPTKVFNSDVESADDIVVWASPNIIFGLMSRQGFERIPSLEFLPD